MMVNTTEPSITSFTEGGCLTYTTPHGAMAGNQSRKWQLDGWLPFLTFCHIHMHPDLHDSRSMP
ncbi:hypothetical protein C6366_03060 [Desulfonatronum sp. SC1]|nr:hypothetical protein C6366_03060 [Desulfonatronum sp. SC1]